MTNSEYQSVIQNKADIAEQIGDWVEDMFDGTFLQAQMIEDDTDRSQVLEAQHNAVEALRTLRRTLESRKIAIAHKAVEKCKAI